MGLKRRLIAQFRRPSGRPGALAGWIMAHRPSNRRRNAWAVELLALPPGARLLEIGCGPGLALEAALAGGAGFALGLDHSPVMIAQAANRCENAIAKGRLELRSGGPEALRPGDLPFDGAVLVNVAHFLPDRPATLARIGDALSPRGRIVIVHQPRVESNKAAAADAMEAALASELEAAGFRVIARYRSGRPDAPVIGLVAQAP